MEKIKQNKNTVLIIGAIVVLVIVFFATNKKTEDAIIVDDSALTNELDGEALGESAATTEIPMPEESSWVAQPVSDSGLTLSIPQDYFVSKPRISGCDATSISTMQGGKPVSIAFVYNVGCEHPDLKVGFSQAIEKNGYIFRTNYTSPSVLAVFERIVNSAN